MNENELSLETKILSTADKIFRTGFRLGRDSSMDENEAVSVFFRMYEGIVER